MLNENGGGTSEPEIRFRNQDLSWSRNSDLKPVPRGLHICKTDFTAKIVEDIPHLTIVKGSPKKTASFKTSD